MEDVFIAVTVIGILFLALPWLILHYATRWKTAASLTREDEDLLDNLHDTARRLEERLMTIERIVAADHPDYAARRGAIDPEPTSYSRSN